MLCVYLHQLIVIKKTYLLKQLQSLYNVIEYQKYYQSGFIYRTFGLVYLNHISCAPGLTARDVCFGSWVPIYHKRPRSSFSVLGLASQVPCKISAPGPGFQDSTFGSRVTPLSWVPALGSTVSPIESRFPGLTLRTCPYNSQHIILTSS